jgi:poly(3-hydroxybutyrate) depolymerase
MKQLCIPVFLLFSFFSQAQNPGCDGVRYKNPVFSSVKVTTVVYAPTVTYGNMPMDLQADVYEPVGDTVSSRPVVILAHGGTFIFGDKSDMAPYCKLLAKQGYVAVSINYRLYPFATQGYPDSTKIMDAAVKAVGDFKASIRYFREDAATTNTFRVDANHIFIGGYSAGSIAALHANYLSASDVITPFISNIVANNGGFEGISGTTSNKTYSSATKATLNMSGGLYRRIWIDSLSVPLMSIHGTADGTVPYVQGLAANLAHIEGSSLLHAQANSVGVWSDLISVPGGDHTNTYSDAQFAPYVDTFWVHATALLESLTCTLTATSEPQKVVPLNFTVQPNPVSGNQVQLILPDNVQTARVIIFNQEGKLVETIQTYRSHQAIELPARLIHGTYTVAVESTDPATPAYGVKQLIKL